MPSAFPGMDPYLEGFLWPGVHAALAVTIRQRLVPLMRPRYSVRLAVYVVHDATPEAEIGIMYPDVEVLQPTSAPTAVRGQTLTEADALTIPELFGDWSLPAATIFADEPAL